jgi:feruloyl esterase
MLLKYLTADLVVVHSAHATIPCSAASFQSIINEHGAPANASVNWATQFAAGDSTFDPSFEFPTNATNLPELCGVSINVPSSESSAYNFAVFLPTDWNQRMMTTGNGGFGGGINVCELARCGDLR